MKTLSQVCLKCAYKYVPDEFGQVCRCGNNCLSLVYD